MRIIIDVGFRDSTEPGPVEIDLPVLLDQPAPQLRAYPYETVIAEKFQAMVMLGLSNSRMRNALKAATTSFKKKIEIALPNQFAINRQTDVDAISALIGQERVLLLVLYGESGCGKSALVKNVLDQRYPEWRQCSWDPINSASRSASLTALS